MEKNIHESNESGEGQKTEYECIELWSVGGHYHNSSAQMKESEELRKQFGYKEDDPEYQFLSKGIEKYEEKIRAKKIAQKVKQREEKGIRELERQYQDQSGVMITREELYSLFEERNPFWIKLRIGNEIREVGYRYAETGSSQKYFERYYCLKQEVSFWYNGLPYWNSLDELMAYLDEISYGQNVFELLEINGIDPDRYHWKKGDRLEEFEEEKPVGKDEITQVIRTIKKYFITMVLLVIAAVLIHILEDFLLFCPGTEVVQPFIHKAAILVGDIIVPLYFVGVICPFIAVLSKGVLGRNAAYFKRTEMEQADNWNYHRPEEVYEKMTGLFGNDVTVMCGGKRIMVYHSMEYERLDFSSIPKSFIDSDLFITDRNQDCTGQLYYIGNQYFFFKEDFFRGLQALDEGQGVFCNKLHVPIPVPRGDVL